jgi:hypothetical protein
MGQGEELDRSAANPLIADVVPPEHVRTEARSQQLPWRRLLAELGVIFLGVFLATAADDWREKRNERETAEKLAVALQNSFEDIRSFKRTGSPERRREIAAFEAALARGERPPFLVVRIKGTQRPPTEVWNAFLAAGGARFFPPDLLFDLAAFYNSFINLGEREIASFRFLEEEVLPALRADPGAGYDSAGRLDPRWAEHLERQKEQLRMLERLAERTGPIEERLFGSLGLPVPPPPVEKFVRKRPLGDKPPQK